jgi:hypothetical protein
MEVKHLSFILSLLLCFFAEAKTCKNVGKDWTWFSDYAVSSIEYAIAMPKNKEIIVGTGMMLFGEPRGSIYKENKPFEIKAYGLGALHLRSKDGSPVKICVDSNGAKAITLYKDEF